MEVRLKNYGIESIEVVDNGSGTGCMGLLLLFARSIRCAIVAHDGAFGL